MNEKKIAFRVSDVSNIDRMSWTDLDTISGLNIEVPLMVL